MNNTKKLRILSLIRYGGEAFYFPFIQLYLTSLGFLENKIGIAIAIIPFISIIFNPFYSFLCKNPKITRNLLIIMGILEAISLIILIQLNSFVWICILIGIISAVSSANFSLIDTIVTISCNNEGKNYSSVRLFGSFAYMISVLLSGYLSSKFNFHLVFYIASAMFFISSMIYFTIHMEKSKGMEEKRDYKKLFTNKSFLLYIPFYVLLVGTMTIGDDFFSTFLNKNHGIESNGYSYIFFGFVFIEVCILFIGNKFSKKLNNKILYLVSLSILTIRMLINALDPNLGIVIIMALSRGITWGIILHVSFKFILDLVGPSNATSGIMIIALVNSLFTAILKIIFGNVIYSVGYKIFYLILFIICLVNIVYYFLVIKRLKVNDELQNVNYN